MTTIGLDRFRNRLAHRLANAALRIATPEYRAWIVGAIQYGLSSAARDVREDRLAPSLYADEFGGDRR